MKRVLAAGVVCLAVVVLAVGHEPGRDMASADVGSGKVSIDYGTPTLGGRNLDEMIKPGTAWRMGMNQATTLETSVALRIGGKTLSPGKYTIFARPDDAMKWTLLVSSSTGNRFDAASVVLEAPMEFAKETASVDMLKITLEKKGAGAMLKVAWGTYRLSADLSAA